MQLKRRRITGWIATLLIALAAGACVRRKPLEDCVNVGSGWRACPTEMSMPAAAGPDTMDNGAGAGTAPDSGSRNPTSPVQSGGQAVGTAGLTAGVSGAAAAGEAGKQSASEGGHGGTSSASASNGGADAPSGSAAASSGGAGGAFESGGRGGMARPEPAGAGGRAGGPSSAGASGTPGDGSGGAGGSGALPNTCCHSLGLCVEESSLTTEQRALLSRDTCEGQARLCAPTPVIGDPRFVPRSCRSVIQAEGRCLPECMSNLAAQAGRFPQDVCGTHEVCAPCFDPITGNATGSCNLGADPGPQELPQRFSGCCPATGSPQGMCVPRGYLAPGVVMPQADCGSDLVCAPRTLVNDPTAKPAQCSADIRGPGICLPQCIGDALALILTVQATCASGDVCYPCELVGGTPTGVCPTNM